MLPPPRSAMVIIGGDGNNTITGGQGKDMIFGGPPRSITTTPPALW